MPNLINVIKDNFSDSSKSTPLRITFKQREILIYPSLEDIEALYLNNFYIFDSQLKPTQ